MAEVSAAFLRAKALQELMVRKVGGDHSVEAEEYEQVRRAFLRDPQMPPHLIPELVKDNRDLDLSGPTRRTTTVAGSRGAGTSARSLAPCSITSTGLSSLPQTEPLPRA